MSMENALLEWSREEKEARISGGIYHEMQVKMTYNSNRIEGSRLSEEQTRMIYETATLEAPVGVPVDDIIETVNHFRAADYCIDAAEEPLDEEHIKRLHLTLKQGTRDSSRPPVRGRGLEKSARTPWAAGTPRARAKFRLKWRACWRGTPLSRALR